MKPFTFLLVLIVAILLAACDSNNNPKRTLPPANISKRTLPPVTNISQLTRTVFVPTLENPIMNGKNIIYAPTLLYAWDEVEKALEAPIKVGNNNSLDFKLINTSTSHLQSLTEPEYATEVDVSGDAIVAKAFFNKTLPFATKFQILDDVAFDKEIVSAFGMQRFDEDIAKCAEILFYHDDDHFVLKLQPKDISHEIILVKGLKGITTLSVALQQTNDLIQKGKRARVQPKQAWKYSINNNDKFTIPVIQFNIEADLEKLSGQQFATTKRMHFIELAYQRTGLILDENGAIVESEVTYTLDSAIAVPQPAYPKNMLLNKTFYVIIKRADKANPYFVMKVENSELLTKSE